MSTGATPTRRRWSSSTAGAIIAATGTGSPPTCARLARHRPRSARPRRQRMVDRRQLRHGGVRLRPRAADPRHRPRAGDASSPIRSAATSRCATPGSIPTTSRRSSRSRGWARRRRGSPNATRSPPTSACGLDRRGPRPRRARSRTLRHDRRGARPHDGREQAPDAGPGAPPDDPRRPPERGRHLQLEVRQLYARVVARRHRRGRPRRRCGGGSPPRRCWSTARRAGRRTRRSTAGSRRSATPASSCSSAPATGSTTTGRTISSASCRQFLAGVAP